MRAGHARIYQILYQIGGWHFQAGVGARLSVAVALQNIGNVYMYRGDLAISYYNPAACAGPRKRTPYRSENGSAPST
jgi:hypothetical protein